MLPRKITFGGGDALVSRSYQAKAGKVRTAKPRTAGVSVLSPDPSLGEAASGELGSEG